MVVTLGETYRPKNIILSPEVNPHIYVPIIFNKETKTIQWGNDIFFSTNSGWKLDFHMQMDEVWPLLYTNGLKT